MRPELSFDGKGINGPDEYRSRIATFLSAEAAEKYGKLFEAAPDLLRALRDLLDAGPMVKRDVRKHSHWMIAEAVARKTLLRVTEGNPGCDRCGVNDREEFSAYCKDCAGRG